MLATCSQAWAIVAPRTVPSRTVAQVAPAHGLPRYAQDISREASVTWAGSRGRWAAHGTEGAAAPAGPSRGWLAPLVVVHDSVFVAAPIVHPAVPARELVAHVTVEGVELQHVPRVTRDVQVGRSRAGLDA